MTNAELFLSQSTGKLFDLLFEEIEKKDPFQMQTILVPHLELKTSIFLEIAKRKKAAIGLSVQTVTDYLGCKPSYLEMLSSIYQGVFPSKGQKKALFLAKELAPVFLRYLEEGFTPKDPWQKKLFSSIAKTPLKAAKDPLICFCIDSLSPYLWQALFQAPSLSIYLFSPCMQFWQDLCSDREKRKIFRSTKDSLLTEMLPYLEEGPSILANWGRLGRKTLETLDAFPTTIKEAYEPKPSQSALTKIQSDLLRFEKGGKKRPDASIEIIECAGSEKEEIEAVKETILKEKIPFSSVALYAASLEPYIPFIQYGFGGEIPYRITHLDLSYSSGLKRGLKNLLSLEEKRWEKGAVFDLLKTPCFRKKCGWSEEDVARIEKWIERAEVTWGLDQNMRSSYVKSHMGLLDAKEKGSWERGFKNLMEEIIFYKGYTPSIDLELFSEFLFCFESLKNLGLQKERTVAEWALFLRDLLDRFFSLEEKNEADGTYEAFLESLIAQMEKASGVFPLSVIMELIDAKTMGSIQGSFLHGVHFSPFKSPIFEKDVIFLLGMDEEGFPRKTPSSPLDLLGPKPYGDRDRYALLEALFAARKKLVITYQNRFREEGRKKQLSSLFSELEELFEGTIRRSFSHREKVTLPKTLFWPLFERKEPTEKKCTIAIEDLTLLASHPWKFYLQKRLGIFLHKEIDVSFALEKKKALRRELFAKTGVSKNAFPRIFSALSHEGSLEAKDLQKQMELWGISPVEIELKESLLEKEEAFFFPALTIHLDGSEVRIVGKSQMASEKGALYFGPHKIESFIKNWPEALVVSCALKTEEIWMVKEGKRLSIKDPMDALHRFVRYYFASLSSPSPLLTPWIDSFLRKGKEHFIKEEKKSFPFEDPVYDWVTMRAEKPSLESLYESWHPFLQEMFSPLVELFPKRRL